MTKRPAGQPAVASPPTPADIGWVGAIAFAKASVLALAIDAFLNSNAPRYRGKAMRVRAIGYTAGLLVAPLAWRARGHRERYPRELDLALTLPLLVDAGGNAIGIYQRAHVDDLVHFANGAVVASVVGAVVSPRVRTSWEAAGIALTTAGTLAGLWEVGEWLGLKLGAKGMNLTYDDTIEDIIETMAGGALGAVLTLLRHPARLRNVPGRAADPVVELQERPGAAAPPAAASA